MCCVFVEPTIGEMPGHDSAIEATAPVNGIAISESTWLRARDREAFGAPETMTLKGVGEMAVYRCAVAPAKAQDPPIAALPSLYLPEYGE